MASAVPIDETESMIALLEWFDDHPCDCATVGAVADGTDYSRETARKNLKQLRAGDYVELVHEPTALYRLVEDPREG